MMSLQECIAKRMDCSDKGSILSLQEISELCKATHMGAPAKKLYVVLPEGGEYQAGIHVYSEKGLEFLTDKGKTKYCMELYPELVRKETIALKDLIDAGLVWQYLSIKAESMGLGVSQRAMRPKKTNTSVNKMLNQEHHFLYTVAVRKHQPHSLIEDTLKPIDARLEEEMILLETPSCYENRAIYDSSYEGVPLDSAIFDQIGKKSPDNSTLNDISQLLWASNGESDHGTHGNRDSIEKNGYGRVHASGCAGHAVYPIVLIENLAAISEGSYWYNPTGLSGLNRWLQVKDQKNYDHLLHRYSANNSKSEIESELGVSLSSYLIIICVDRKKPCSGFAHGKIGKLVMNTELWADVEAGMALAGLQLQANALGLKWQKKIISNPADSKLRTVFGIEEAEKSIGEMAEKLLNKPKNERLSLKGPLIPMVLFWLE